ncbi:Winged helix DNA-binding domain-containing protein [Flavobacterium longum]|uniref:winged helix DNA-binding domain-containing protein n=1 Tax=Flavobacterium longum TaxID=1299340 RepID=UPI0039EBD61B
MTRETIVATRLQAQLLHKPTFNTAPEVVKHFGAMQAQDYPMSLFAVGVRSPGSTYAQIEQALDDGHIIRTHVLRPTWHLAPAEDIGWMLELTSENILRQMKSMNAKLGLDAKLFTKSADIIMKAVSDGEHKTRDELTAILNAHSIRTDQYRGLHILAYAELQGLICNGRRAGKHHSYALMSERVKHPRRLGKEAALAELALRYFTSHGPATLRDFIWWSGLLVAEAKTAVALTEKELANSTMDGEVYYWKEAGHAPTDRKVMLLPSFDEYLIAYKNRRAAIDEKHMPHAFTSNGIFKPLIVSGGEVVGVWKRTDKKNRVEIEPTFLKKVSKAVEKDTLDAAERFGLFLGKEASVRSR